MRPTRVVVVEDSLVQRAHLVRTLEADGDLTVVGEAADARSAVDVVQTERPDLVTLDLQIPGGGQDVIEQIMASTPLPILVLSATVGGRESAAAIDALVAGAVDILPKPTRWDASAEAALRTRARIVARVAVVRHRRARSAPSTNRTPAAPTGKSTRGVFVAIGSSTGGPAALAQVLSGLGGLDASVLVVQHLHPDFVGGLVSWMARASPLAVELASAGVRAHPGVVYIAPAGVHLRIGPDDEMLLEPLPETLHRPSVDALFHSLADRKHGRNIGVLLTGMGEDGAAGLLALRRRGDVTIAQDEATSVVFGMPKAAQKLGAVTHMVALERIASTIKKVT